MAQDNPANRVGGVVFMKLDGKRLSIRGKWTLRRGEYLREAVVGLDGTHGYTEKPQACRLEGEVTPGQDLDIRGLQRVRDATITVEWGSGKVEAIRNGWYASEGEIDLEEGSMACAFEGLSCETVS